MTALCRDRFFCMRPANEERRRHNVKSSLIGWAHTQNDPWSWVTSEATLKTVDKCDLPVPGSKCLTQVYLEFTLQWRHNGQDGVSIHQPRDCLLNPLFRRRSWKTSKLLVTGLCAGNSPVTGEFPAQRASNEENIFIWWRHHDHLIRPTQRTTKPCACLMDPSLAADWMLTGKTNGSQVYI